MSLFIRLVIAMVALVLLTAALVGLLAYRNLEEAVLPRTLERIEIHTKLLASEFESPVRGARADVLGFRSAVALEGIVRAHLAGGIDPEGGTTEAAWRQRMARRYAAELASKPAYSQLRIIGIANDGRELVRVDRYGPGGSVRIIPDPELEPKGDRDYFAKTIVLKSGEVYVSKIDLSPERGPPRIPLQPTLRVATPIHTPGGEPFGILVINVDLKPIFDRLRSLTQSGGELYVVDDDGDYLLHPDRAREFGFEFGRRSRWQDDFPELASAISASQSKVLVLRDQSGARAGAGLLKVELAGSTVVYLIEVLPSSVIMAPAGAIRQSTILAGSFAALIAALLAILLARSLTRPLVEMTRAVVAGSARGAPFAFGASAGGEVGALARAFSGMSREVQEQAAALQQEIAQRQRLFDTSLDLILVVDRKGNFLQVSPSCKTIVGYEPDEMVGRSAADFILPEDLESTRDEMRAARRGRNTRYFECRYVHRDGHPVVLQWTGVWSEQEQQHYFIGRDVTERQYLFDILTNTINAMVDAVLVADSTRQSHHFQSSRRAADGDFLRRRTGRVVTAERGYRARRRFCAVPRRAAVDARCPRRTGLEFLHDGLEQAARNDGSLRGDRWPDSRPLRTESRAPLSSIVTSPPHAKPSGNLQQAQKMEAVGELTGGIAHDFNNILTVITGTIEILADAVVDKPGLAAVAKMIDEAAGRGADLTQRLLAFARRQPLQPHEVDVNALVTDATKLLRPTLGEHIEIRTALSGDLSAALVDPNQLSSAIINLAINSRDAMPNGGKLTLETSSVHLDESYAKAHSEVQPGDYVLIAVSDTGEGIPPDILDRVFEPFFTTKDVGRGSGLGLSMVYGFIKQSGGHIKIYSEVGHGTAIKLYLPQAAGDALAAQEAVPQPIESGTETILVVEDDALVRNYVVAQLKSLGYDVLTAANAAEALKIIDQAETLDLLFTDVIMPGGMNGRQLSDAAAKLRPGLKVLFTSGYTENAIVHHGRLDPACCCLRSRTANPTWQE